MSCFAKIAGASLLAVGRFSLIFYLKLSMKIVLDGNELNALPGETVLEVAARQGIQIPTLCYRNEDDCRGGSTSCLVCLVKIKNGSSERFVPACATKIEDGMIVESETDEVAKLRRTSLELLLSDHSGDCYAPCQLACPAGLDIPKMLREIKQGNPASAIRTVKETIPLPAVLGRICPRPCEKICRRRSVDSPVGICDMKRYVADLDLGSSDGPYFPTIADTTGKRVVVVGAGPSGLSAAYYLARFGHHVSIYAQGKKPGGRLRLLDEKDLPESVLDAEIHTILSLPVEYHPGERLDWTDPKSLSEIRDSFDAVLLCTGPCDLSFLKKSGFDIENDRLRVDTKSFTTSISGVFATGTIFRARSTMIVRSVADGHEAAKSIDRFLREGFASPNKSIFSVRLGKLNAEELIAFTDAHRNKDETIEQKREDSSPAKQAAVEAGRCLHCDCRGRDACLLLEHSERYHADQQHFSDKKRPPLVVKRSGPVVFEPGKCIKCGLCISVAKKNSDQLGLTFIGRGFDVRVASPFNEPLEKALKKTAFEAVRVCPTAALSLDDDMEYMDILDKNRNG